MRPWGIPNVPKPVADISEPLESIALAIFAKIRHLRSGYVGVFHLDGAFYVFHEESNGWRLWFRTHRNTFVCSLTRMERPEQIAAKIAATCEKYLESRHDNVVTDARSRENGEADEIHPEHEQRSGAEERSAPSPTRHSGGSENPCFHPAERRQESSASACVSLRRSRACRTCATPPIAADPCDRMAVHVRCRNV